VDRREFLKLTASLALEAGLAPAMAGEMVCSAAKGKKRMNEIQTVVGPIKSEALGVTLIHEHVLVDFPDKGHPVRDDHATPRDYDADEVIDVMLPHFIKLREAGGNTLVECTPKHIGRDARVLQRLAAASGVNIIAATGFYYEGYLPKYILEADVDAIAEHLVREATEGMDGASIRAGLMKIATNAEKGGCQPLSSFEERMMRAAARAHLTTGIPIASHTGYGDAALKQLDVLAQEGVHGSAFIWVHADAFVWLTDGREDIGLRREAAARGAWIELDSLCNDGIKQELHIAAVKDLLAAGFESQILLSQDAGWYTVGQPRGGAQRPYHPMLTEFMPALEKAEIPDAVSKFLIDNPRRALTPQVRRL